MDFILRLQDGGYSSNGALKKTTRTFKNIHPTASDTDIADFFQTLFELQTKPIYDGRLRKYQEIIAPPAVEEGA